MTPIIHVIQIILFLVVLAMLGRRMTISEQGYVPVTATGFFPIRSYTVLPLLFLAVVVLGIWIGDDFSLFGEAILLTVTLAMMVFVGTAEELDPLGKTLSWVVAALSFTGFGLVMVRAIFGV